jgi:hypothetical protein
VIDLFRDLLTVDQIITTPLEEPLPKVRDIDTPWMASDTFAQRLEEARASPDFHLAVSHYSGDFEYYDAIVAIACRFADLRKAFQDLSQLHNRTQVEELFISKFNRYARMII